MKNLKKYFTLTAALALTAVLAATVDKYQATSGELLTNGGFEQGLAGWNMDGPAAAVSANDGVLHIELREPGKSIEIEQTVTGVTDQGFVLLAGELKSSKLVPGPKPWHRARLDFSRYGAKEKWLPLPHNVASLEGSTAWLHYQEIFRLVGGVARSAVTIQMPHTTGDLWVKNLSLHQVVPATGFNIARIFLFLMWAATLIWLFVPHIMGGNGKLLGVATGLALAVIIVGTMLPASSKSRWQGEIKELVHTGESALTGDHTATREEAASGPGEQIYLIGNIEIGKVGHFAFFGLLGFLLLARTGGGSILPVLFDTAALGAATELMQFFVEGRTPLLSDFATDMGGVATGLFICLVFVRQRSLKIVRFG